VRDRRLAEGVESEAQCERLKGLGCDEMQGYYISPPLPADDFVAWSRQAPWPLGVAGTDRPG
jgi:EAL domain-containing protein (putative c-di-GMP-specific phosphodiesterase class I)